MKNFTLPIAAAMVPIAAAMVLIATAMVLTFGAVAHAERSHGRGYQTHHYAPQSYRGRGPAIYTRGYRGPSYGYSGYGSPSYGYSSYGNRHYGQRTIYFNFFGLPVVTY